MNVHRSCHLAFLDKKSFEPVYESKPTPKTPASEYADVRVKNDKVTLAIIVRIHRALEIRLDLVFNYSQRTL
jgi:hypothetical protein